MPQFHHPLPLSSGALPALARWLLGFAADGDGTRLAEGLVILPSSRAASSLRHELLTVADGDALLLPAIMTPRQLADWLAARHDLADDTLPHESLRPLLLAPHLAAIAWPGGGLLAGHPHGGRSQAAVGLAEELVAVFDDVRWARADALVLEGRDDARLLAYAAPDAADVLLDDLARIRAAWQAYRGVQPQDRVDRRLAGLARGWSGPAPAWLVVAHLGRLEPALAAWIRARSDEGVPTHTVTFTADDARSRLLLATYRDTTAPAHPLAGVRNLARRLADTDAAAPGFAAADVAGRLTTLDTGDLTRGDVVLWSCHDPEHESRVVAGAVCEALAAAGDGEAPQILVATPDLGLAARIVAQLRDAGVDADDTRGRPLAALPAGRLLRDLLRTVQTGWRFGPLFEVLTHPYVNLAPDGRPSHAVRARILESEIRRRTNARGGRNVLIQIAADADTNERDGNWLDWTYTEFVADIVAALEPLDVINDQLVAWGDVVLAIGESWQRLASKRPLVRGSDQKNEIGDIDKLAELLGAISAAAMVLPSQSGAEIVYALGRLLGREEWMVPRHRAEDLPVRVTGLVEARLEHADLAILAGLNQETFPGRLARPLFLDDRVRRGLGLAHAREQAGRDGELFLRLLHAAPRVVVTWPTERQGQPALPSPLVQRVQLVAPAGVVMVAPAHVAAPFRRAAPDLAAIHAAERAFATEADARIAAGSEPPTRLSHASLSELRGCAYRYLLGRVLRLRRAEALEPSYTRLEYGQFAHDVMKSFLAPEGDGWRALANGDAQAAAALLRRLADDEADKGLPQARLWRETFLAMVPDLVATEVARAAQWRPAVLEVPFTLTLDEVAAWLRTAGHDADADCLPPSFTTVPIEGRIDRLDLARDGSPRAAVIDFKTGRPPTAADVRAGLELQVVLYALAVEAGAVHGLEAAPGGARWRVDHGGYYGLRADAVGMPRGPQLPPGDAGRATLAQAAAILLRLAVACLHPEASFPLVQPAYLAEHGHKLPCEFCEFRAICRVEERVRDGEVASRLTSFLTGDWRRYA